MCREHSGGGVGFGGLGNDITNGNVVIIIVIELDFRLANDIASFLLANAIASFLFLFHFETLWTPSAWVRVE